MAGKTRIADQSFGNGCRRVPASLCEAGCQGGGVGRDLHHPQCRRRGKACNVCSRAVHHHQPAGLYVCCIAPPDTVMKTVSLPVPLKPTGLQHGQKLALAHGVVVGAVLPGPRDQTAREHNIVIFRKRLLR